MGIETCPVLEKYDAEKRANIENAFCWYLSIQPRFPRDIGGWTLASSLPLVKSLPEDDAAFLREVVATLEEHGTQYSMAERLRPFQTGKPLGWEDYVKALAPCESGGAS